MVRLEREDRRDLLQFLESLPAMQNYRGRRLLLETAGLEMLVSQLELEGPPYIVVGDIVRTLESYGRVTFDHEALGVLLNTLKGYVGPADDRQDLIDRLLIRYDLMTPAKSPGKDMNWRGQPSLDDLDERIIGENTLKHIAFLGRAIQVSRSVALVDVGGWVGTGFMISSSLLMTNNHVLPDPTLLPNTVFRFNYQLTLEGAEEKVHEYAAKASGYFHTNNALDYTVVELDEEPGKEWGTLVLSSMMIPEGERVYIVQHPGGLPKQISFQNNFVEYADSRVVQYVTSTMCGSSGSPVFNETWLVIAVHHAGGVIPEPKSNRRYFRNEGISIGAILYDLPSEVRLQLGTA